MKALRLYVFAILLVCANFVFGQSQSYLFGHSKSIGDKNVVYFKIADLGDDVEEHDRVLEILVSDSHIFDGNIYSEEKSSISTCQLEIDGVVSVEYVRNVLKSAGYDIELSSVTPDSGARPKTLRSSEAYSFSSLFNPWKDYDINEEGSMQPEEHYAKEKDNWVNENPGTYNTAKEQGGTTVIVKRKDLEFFKEEKRQHILSHPEIFIIED